MKTGTFRSLANYNYRLWAGGALVSNVGTWMQRVAQDWLVLTQLTHNNASAVGVVMALQFGPQMLMLPFSGFAADFFDAAYFFMASLLSSGGQWKSWLEVASLPSMGDKSSRFRASTCTTSPWRCTSPCTASNREPSSSLRWRSARS